MHTPLQKGWSRCGSQEDMHTCSNVYTHFNQGVGLEDYQDYSGIDPHDVTTYKIVLVMEQWCWH